MAGNKDAPRGRKEKGKTKVSLPNARKSIKRQRNMAQGKANFEGWWSLFAGIFAVLLIAFILMGGINQRKFAQTMDKWSTNIGNKVSEWIKPDSKVIVNDDGIYVDPNEDGQAGN